MARYEHSGYPLVREASFWKHRLTRPHSTGAEGEYTPKIPTIIAYDEHDKSKFTWGASVDRTKDNIQGVKLLLDPDQERPLYLPTSTMKWDLKRLPKAPMEVAADFIGAMYKHALSEIAKEVPASYLSVCQKEFVLSGKPTLTIF